MLTHEEQGEDEGELVHGMAQNVLHHGPRDERLVAAVRFPQEQSFGRRFCGQGQGGKRVHDEVHPKHLHGLERGVLQQWWGEDRHLVSHQSQRAGSQQDPITGCRLPWLWCSEHVWQVLKASVESVMNCLPQSWAHRVDSHSSLASGRLSNILAYFPPV